MSPPGAPASGVSFDLAGIYLRRGAGSDGNSGSVASDVTVNAGSGVDPRADLNHDGVVIARDRQTVIANFGQTVP